MLRRAQQFAVILAASLAATLLALQAQEANISPASRNRASVMTGINVPPVPGAPFSATLVIEDERSDFLGSQVHRTINLIARDSKGRTHNETRRLMPESFHGSPQILSVRLYDPETHTRTILDPVLHLGRRQLTVELVKAETASDPAVHKQDLGTSVFDGLPTKGTRSTLSLSARESGTGDPIEIEKELWYSEDLHLVMLLRYSDSRAGTQTLGVSSLKRDEPPASMFEVPPGYKIDDASPNSAPAAPASGTPAPPPIP
jgi:hypothetical protein